MLPVKNRFHGHGSLRYVYQNGASFRTRRLVLRVTKNPRRKHSRVAIVVSKKVLKSAVGRNRIRRRLYAEVHVRIAEFRGVYDLVFVVTSAELRDIEHAEVGKAVHYLLTQAGVYGIEK